MKTIRLDVIIDFEYFDAYEFKEDFKDFLRDRDANVKLISPIVEIENIEAYLGL